MEPYWTEAGVTVWHGDCLDVLATLADASVDAVCTDPPYGLGFMGREWDRPGMMSRTDAQVNSILPAGGQAAVEWSPHPFQSWRQQWAAECLRVLKPGGHLLAFGGTRTFHRLACAIEDAGFEIRDSIAWLYGSGFPKSLDVSKAIDKAAGAEREVVGQRDRYRDGRERQNLGPVGGEFLGLPNGVDAITAPATDDARTWQGWGTALKPAFEPIIVARKPLAGTVAANVLQHGTGALNVEACRITASGQNPEPSTSRGSADSSQLDSTFCTCPEPIGDHANRTPSSRRRDASGAALSGRNDRPASAQQGAPEHRPLPDSLDGCRSSRRSDDGPAHGQATGGQAPVPRPLDADTSRGRCASCGRTRSSQAKPCDKSTAPHIQREPTRAGEASADRRYVERGGTDFAPLPGVRGGSPAGRWPANVVLDESQAAALDEMSGTLTSGVLAAHHTRNPKASGILGAYGSADGERGYGDQGGASRFFYVAREDESCGHSDGDHATDTLGSTDPAPLAAGELSSALPVERLTSTRAFYTAKATSAERPRVNGIAHPTVKPLSLMRWLVRLVTPPGGLVLDPFAGSGTTVEACQLEGFRCIAIEREADYLPLITDRLRQGVLDFEGTA